MRGAAVPVVYEKRERSISRGMRVTEAMDREIQFIAKREGVTYNQVIISLLRGGLAEDERQHPRKR